ncbi:MULTISPECIES: hypothetical protein [Asaia]|uniref:Uncharacterized protein n=1 Tax=Asaia bogorensis TaxID=91915 RepID=A0A060QJ41_9PROT|nr:MULTISPECIES: hypothetical protein [Asaia]ETC99363.1 hypothetical protein P792_04400 [Asaia sp. SF2.1]MDL2171334.1 hypothetical protein [Asaia sp. HumB]CDG38802.1 hypothetical protein ASAP_0757 [Asaia bogorensis]
MVPGQIQTVRLVSRLFHPAWAEGSHYGPSRGVLVGKITFFDSNRTHTMTEHLDSPALDGWREKHSAQSRWTSGDAMLSLGDQDPIDPGVLSIEILSDETYEDDDL